MLLPTKKSAIIVFFHSRVGNYAEDSMNFNPPRPPLQKKKVTKKWFSLQPWGK
jgi:hypothetical protein